MTSDTATGSSSSVTVCLVEDHQGLREQLQEFLDEAGVTVLASVGTIHEGEEVVARYRPDVAIIDYRLPDGTGIELIRTLARTAPQMTLLLYTASATEQDARRAALEAGATAVIAKSIQAGDLLSAIRAGRRPRPAG